MNVRPTTARRRFPRIGQETFRKTQAWDMAPCNVRNRKFDWVTHGNWLSPAVWRCCRAYSVSPHPNSFCRLWRTVSDLVVLYLLKDFKLCARCMMALTRGVNASFPCPTCLVPKAEIPNLAIEHRLRTTEEMQAVWNRASQLNATDSEDLLRSYGLMDVEVTFIFFL